jgi:hypothetical protein
MNAKSMTSEHHKVQKKKKKKPNKQTNPTLRNDKLFSKATKAQQYARHFQQTHNLKSGNFSRKDTKIPYEIERTEPADNILGSSGPHSSAD